MRARFLALALAAGLLAASAAPAAAAGQGDVGAALGDAGAAAGLMRLVAGSVPETSVRPELGELVSPTASFEAGFGLSNAGVNTAAELPFERALAQATPFGAALTGRAPSSAGGLVQTAPPGNPEASERPLRMPESPVNDLVRAEKLRGDTHARWSKDRGPCVGTVAVSGTSTGRFWLGTAVATLPDIEFADLGLPAPPAGLRPPGTLGTLGGLLTSSADGSGALVRLPRGISTRSTVALVDVGERKAVRSTSVVRADRIELLPGSPLGMTATVRQAPTLTATATGNPRTSRIVHDTPIVEVRRGSTRLFRLDRTRESDDIAIGIPKAGFQHRGKLRAGPVVGGFAESASGKPVRLPPGARRNVVDLFVLRLSVSGLNTRSTAVRDPFTGHQLAASARLLDVQLLPTKALADALAERYDVPSTLAQYSLGEQVVRAAAPDAGARCGRPGAGDVEQAALPTEINTSSPAAWVRPLLWGGAALLLLGAYLLAVLRPRRTRPSNTEG